MHDLESGLSSIYLRSGEIHAAERPALVKTILGSCVSAVFFNRCQRIGAMCHALLPGGDCRSEGFKYLDRAMYWMLEWFDSRFLFRA